MSDDQLPSSPAKERHQSVLLPTPLLPGAINVGKFGVQRVEHTHQDGRSMRPMSCDSDISSITESEYAVLRAADDPKTNYILDHGMEAAIAAEERGEFEGTSNGGTSAFWRHPAPKYNSPNRAWEKSGARSEPCKLTQHRQLGEASESREERGETKWPYGPAPLLSETVRAASNQKTVVLKSSPDLVTKKQHYEGCILCSPLGSPRSSSIATSEPHEYLLAPSDQRAGPPPTVPLPRIGNSVSEHVLEGELGRGSYYHSFPTTASLHPTAVSSVERNNNASRKRPYDHGASFSTVPLDTSSVATTDEALVSGVRDTFIGQSKEMAWSTEVGESSKMAQDFALYSDGQMDDAASEQSSESQVPLSPKSSPATARTILKRFSGNNTTFLPESGKCDIESTLRRKSWKKMVVTTGEMTPSKSKPEHRSPKRYNLTPVIQGVGILDDSNLTHPGQRIDSYEMVELGLNSMPQTPRAPTTPKSPMSTRFRRMSTVALIASINKSKSHAETMRRRKITKWILITSVVVAFIVGLTMLILFVALPASIKGEANNSIRNVSSIVISDVTPQSAALQLNLRVGASSGVPAYDYNGLELYFKDLNSSTPLSRVEKRNQALVRRDNTDYVQLLVSDLSTIISTNDTRAVNGSDREVDVLLAGPGYPNQTFAISNLEAWQGLLSTLLFNDTFQLRIQGIAFKKIAGVKISVDLDRTLNSAGMSNFTDMRITEYQFATDGAFDGVVSWSNPSMIDLALDEFDFDLYIGQSLVGNGSFPEFHITSENSFSNFSAFVDVGKFSNDTELLSSLLSAVSGSSTPQIRFQGRYAFSNGTEIPWLSAILRNFEKSVPVAVNQSNKGTAQNFAMNLTMVGNGTDLFAVRDGWVSFDTDYLEQMNNFSVAVRSAGYNMQFVLPGQDRVFAELRSDLATNTTTRKTSRGETTVFSALGDSVVSVTDDSIWNGDFLKGFISEKLVPVVVKGNFRVDVETVYGDSVVDGLSFGENDWSINGLDGLDAVGLRPLELGDVRIVGSLTGTVGSLGGLEMKADVGIYSSGDFAVDLGDLEFHLNYDGEDIGNITLENISLSPGQNQHTTTIMLGSESTTAVSHFLSEFLRAGNVTVQLQGYDGTSAVNSINGALSTRVISAVVSSPGYSFVYYINFKFTSNDVEAVFSVINPLQIPITVASLDLTVTSPGSSTPLGGITKSFTAAERVQVNPAENNGMVQTVMVLQTSIPVAVRNRDSLARAVDNGVVDVNGTLGIVWGGWEMEVQYGQRVRVGQDAS
ncbi:hypothetical protein RUND412_001956 [Rhizina undulata]